MTKSGPTELPEAIRPIEGRASVGTPNESDSKTHTFTYEQHHISLHVTIHSTVQLQWTPAAWEHGIKKKIHTHSFIEI